MTLDEAKKELAELRGLHESGAALAPYRGRIARLYEVVCKKKLKKCRCRNIYSDTIAEIYYKLKTAKTMDNVSKSRLVNGVVIFVDGQHYSNSNLTDEVARKFLSSFPQRRGWFSVLPPAEREASEAEMPENGTKIVSKGIKPQSQTTTPKKKKNPKKRK